MKVAIIAINAKNIHKAVAPWCLKAYAEREGFDGEIEVVEANVNEQIIEVVGRIYRTTPNIAAFGCYIWNIEYIKKVTEIVKKLLPKVTVVFGGPEIAERQDGEIADYIIQGAGERPFFELLMSLRKGAANQSCNEDTANEIASSASTQEIFADYPTPYTDDYFKSFATDQISDIANRLVYYESSRGCPFVCSYCLSSVKSGTPKTASNVQNPNNLQCGKQSDLGITSSVTCVSLTRVKRDIVMFLAHGAKCVKFVDRTFNADKTRAKEILIFLGELETDCVFHFEVVADLFDAELLKIIYKLPHGRVQFEIGIQSTNPRTLTAIDRKTNIPLALKNVKKLVDFGNCHIHVDLIAGLPFETIESFAKGFDKCIEAQPHHLQLGFLKLLKGTKLRQDAGKYGIVYAGFPPYEVYKTKTMSYDDIMLLKKVEGVVKRFWNKGDFKNIIDQGIDKVGSALVFFYGLANYIESQNKFGGGADVRISMKNAEIVLNKYVDSLN